MDKEVRHYLKITKAKKIKRVREYKALGSKP
jgi:hypothetical protein